MGQLWQLDKLLDTCHTSTRTRTNANSLTIDTRSDVATHFIAQYKMAGRGSGVRRTHTQ